MALITKISGSGNKFDKSGDGRLSNYKLAIKEDGIIITMDKDFGELVFKNNNLHKGVLLLRLDDAVSEEKLAAIQNLIPEHLEQLKNNFSVYQNGKLRTK